MNYQQTLDYLYAQLPMYSRIGAAAYKADLDNTIALCNYLDNPQNKIKCIHVAGTNGKGSTSHMLAAILQQAGYKTGLYTSPHLKDFRERIKINGEPVSQSFVVDFVAATKTISEEISPSFFELTVAMAFDYFHQENIDIAVIETGLGGRLDSTNIITPLLSIITNIGYDHMDMLGNTLALIAAEKAGIIKAGVPVIVGESLPETKDIFIKKSEAVQAPVYFAQEEIKITDLEYDLRKLTCKATYLNSKDTITYSTDLNGVYQAKNLATVLNAVEILRTQGFLLPAEVVQSAMSSVKPLTGLWGRWDLIHETPPIILDVAHNADGIKQVLTQLAFAGKSTSDVHFILGMVKDKDISAMLSLLPKDAKFSFTNAHIERALPHTHLQEKAAAFSLKGESFDLVNEAIKDAIISATPATMIIVSGSVFLIGEVEPELFQPV